MRDLQFLFTAGPLTYARYTYERLAMLAAAEAAEVFHRIAAIQLKRQVRDAAEAIERQQQQRHGQPQPRWRRWGQQHMERLVALGSIFFVIGGFFLKGAVMVALGLLILWLASFVYQPMAAAFAGSMAPNSSPPTSQVSANLVHSGPEPPPVPASFVPSWVKNHHELTEMWSGPVGQAGVISFGRTSSQFCSFLVVRPQDNARLYVWNPYSNNYFWVDAKAVGPAPPPERRSGSKPANQNCAEVIYDR